MAILFVFIIGVIFNTYAALVVAPLADDLMSMESFLRYFGFVSLLQIPLFCIVARRDEWNIDAPKSPERHFDGGTVISILLCTVPVQWFVVLGSVTLLSRQNTTWLLLVVSTLLLSAAIRFVRQRRAQ